MRSEVSPLAKAICMNLPESEKQLFFTDGKTDAAKRICNGTDKAPPCPVKDACLAHVLSWELGNGRYGVYAGLSARQRRNLFPNVEPDTCRKGLHPMSEENTHWHNNVRRCMKCRNATAERYKRKRSGAMAAAS